MSENPYNFPLGKSEPATEEDVEDNEFLNWWEKLEQYCKTNGYDHERPKFYAFIAYMEGKKKGGQQAVEKAMMVNYVGCKQNPPVFCAECVSEGNIAFANEKNCKARGIGAQHAKSKGDMK